MQRGKIIGPRLWELAKARGVDPPKLASRTGIRVNSLYQYGSPTSPRPLGQKNAAKIALALNLTVPELYGDASDDGDWRAVMERRVEEALVLAREARDLVARLEDRQATTQGEG